MKKLVTTLSIFVAVLAGALLDSWVRPAPVQAQTTAQVEFSYVAAHSSCAPATSTTVFCFAADTGLWLSLNGSSTFTQVGAAANGVTSVQVCNAAGASCGTAQTGAVVLDIPKTATLQ